MSLSRIRQVLEQRGDIRQVIVFGSMAAGSARADSDLDIAIDLGHPMSGEEKLALIRTLAPVTGRPVDVVDLHSVGVPLLGQILRHGTQVLGSKTDRAELMRRHVFDSQDFLPYVRRMLRERRQRWIGTS